MYCVFAARLTEGTSIAVSPLTTTGPVTVAPPAVGRKVKLAVVSVELVIDLEKVADTEEFKATLVSAFDGEVLDTDGGVVSEESVMGATTFPSSTGGFSPPAPPPPPQPNRLRLASRHAEENMRAKILALVDLIFLLPFDMCVPSNLRLNLKRAKQFLCH